jgi:hypothetical protein
LKRFADFHETSYVRNSIGSHGSRIFGYYN